MATLNLSLEQQALSMDPDRVLLHQPSPPGAIDDNTDDIYIYNNAFLMMG